MIPLFNEPCIRLAGNSAQYIHMGMACRIEQLGWRAVQLPSGKQAG